MKTRTWLERLAIVAVCEVVLLLLHVPRYAHVPIVLVVALAFYALRDKRKRRLHARARSRARE